MPKVVFLRLRNRTLNRFKEARTIKPITKTVTRAEMLAKGNTLLYRAFPISLFEIIRNRIAKSQQNRLTKHQHKSPIACNRVFLRNRRLMTPVASPFKAQALCA